MNILHSRTHLPILPVYFLTIFETKIIMNTPGTRAGPGGRDQTLAVKKMKITFFLHISFSYAKILRGNKFSHTGVSPKWVKSKRRRETEKREVITTAKLHMARTSTHGARKPPGLKKYVKTMASFASSATTCGARKHAWTNRKI